jgi:hypothetical protein
MLLSGRRIIEPRMFLPSATTASSSATSGQIASSLPAACGAEAVTYTRNTPRKEIRLQPQHAATVGWHKEKKHIQQIIGAADTRRRRCRKCSRRRHPRLQREGCSLPTSPLQACPSRRSSEARQRNSSCLRHIRWEVPTQWNPGSLRPYPNTNSRKQVSQFGPQM